MVEIREDLPHTITEWVASAVCTNARSGLGVAPRPASVTAFQPFFASFSLPYSTVRGETVPVKVTVFNYMQDCLVVSGCQEQWLIKKDEKQTKFCVLKRNVRSSPRVVLSLSCSGFPMFTLAKRNLQHGLM